VVVVVVVQPTPNNGTKEAPSRPSERILEQEKVLVLS